MTHFARCLGLLIVISLMANDPTLASAPRDEASADLAFEQGDLEAALVEYQGLLEGPLSPADRRRVLGKVGNLRRQLGFRLRLLMAIEEGQIDTLTLGGHEGRPLSGDGGGVMVSTGGLVEYVRWNQAKPEELLTLFEEIEADPAAQLDFAAFCFASGLEERGDQALIEASQQADLKPQIDAILAHARGLDSEIAAGFVLVDGDWISLDENRKRKRAGSLADLSDQARDHRPERRREAWELLAEKENGRPVLAAVLDELLTEKLEDLAKAKEMRQIELLLEDRALLEERREHALELIFDSERYTKDPLEIYQEAQTEVELRVEKVEELWSSRRRARQIKLGASFRRDVQEAQALVAACQEFELPMPDLGENPVWRLLDPSQRRLSLQNLARDEAEAEALRYDQELLAHNEEVEGPSDPERDQVRITNDYRRMMGRRVLHLDARLWEAARGHSEEMSLLGYFSHTSPTEERETMGKRAQLAGYTKGAAGENIYNGSGSAQAAHDAWFRSPPHHRNILTPSHTAMGSGLGGGRWTQNYGSAPVEL